MSKHDKLNTNIDKFTRDTAKITNFQYLTEIPLPILYSIASD